MGLSLGALLVLSGCPGDDAPTMVDDSGSSDGTGSTGQPVTTNTTPPDPTDTDTDAMTGDGTMTGVDTTAGMDTTDGTDGTDTTATPPECGNDLVEDGEECDGSDLDGEDCVTQGFVAGRLACNDDCTFDVTGCADRLCGDDTIQGMEVCDGTDLGGEDCMTQGFDGGTLACLGGCRGYDTSGCFACGDDAIGGMEVCDGVDLGGEDCVSQGFDAGMLGCLADCSGFDPAGCFSCGDGVTEGMEVCDGADLGAEDCTTQGFDFGMLGCLADCSGYDTMGCGNFGGDCCAANGTPGCDDATCTTDVCAADPFCCDNQWDGVCANAAFTLCPAICDNCGDGAINSPVETCDGVDLGGEDCVTQGFDAGALGCLADCSAFDTAGCISFMGDCCAANGTPGCDDATCTADVCAADPFCCDNQWDGICGNAAFTLCPAVCDNCGDGAINSPVETCDGADLAGEDCVSQGFDRGVLGCQADCSAYDTAGCVTFGGACCSANGTPGCEDAACTAAVCAVDPFCCDTQWDLACANGASNQPACMGVSDCPSCGDGVINGAEVCDGADLGGQDCTTQGFGGGNLACAADCAGFDTSGCVATNPGQSCCSASGGGSPACSDATCTASICAIDPFCCNTDWDSICANRANGSDGNGNQCDICGFGCAQELCLAGTENSACQPTNACVGSICAADPFCCSNSWDGICVNEVGTVCGLTCP